MSLIGIDVSGIDRTARDWQKLERMSAPQINQLILNAAEPVARDLILRVQSRMNQVGRGDLAKHVRTIRTRRNLHVGIYAGPEAQQALDMEFGTQDAAPIPVLRSVVNDNFRRLSHLLDQNLQRAVFNVAP